MFLAYIPYAPIPNMEALKALMPPDRQARFAARNPAPLFAYGLLSLVLDRHYSLDAQDIRYTEAGRPYLPGDPVHISLSHTRTHALCAVSEAPVGCDIEVHRPVSPRTIQRVLADGESEADFFAYWTLKESYFKLTGDLSQPFSSIFFQLADDSATRSDAQGFVYREIPNCTTAVVAHELFFRPSLQEFTSVELFSYADKKWA